MKALVLYLLSETEFSIDICENFNLEDENIVLKSGCGIESESERIKDFLVLSKNLNIEIGTNIEPVKIKNVIKKSSVVAYSEFGKKGWIKVNDFDGLFEKYCVD